MCVSVMYIMCLHMYFNSNSRKCGKHSNISAVDLQSGLINKINLGNKYPYPQKIHGMCY